MPYNVSGVQHTTRVLLIWYIRVHASAIAHLSYAGLDRNSLFQTDTVSNVPCLLYKNMVREPTGKMKNGKAAGPSAVVSKLVKVAKARGAVYWAKYKAKRKRFENAMWRDYHK